MNGLLSPGRRSATQRVSLALDLSGAERSWPYLLPPGRFFMSFALGMVFYAYRHRVAISVGLLVSAGLLAFTLHGSVLEKPAFVLMAGYLALVLGTGVSAVVMRQMRSSMLDSLGADYVRTARAKGVPEWRVVGVHAFRNSLITVTTIIGVQLGTLISGAVITESIFGIAGFGRLTIDAVDERDYALILRLVDPNTDQTVITAAGISVFGTMAASEFLTDSRSLSELRSPASPQ